MFLLQFVFAHNNSKVTKDRSTKFQKWTVFGTK